MCAAAIEYVTVAYLADVPPGTVISVRAGERWYALANVDGVLHALDNNCPHNGGPLGKGETAAKPSNWGSCLIER